MNAVGRVVVSLCVALSGVGAVAAQEHAPPLADVRAELCGAQNLRGRACADAGFELVGALRERSDRPLHVFVLASGGPDECRIRHACFSLVMGRRGAWRVVFSGIGGEVSLVPHHRRGRPADLLVAGADSASEFTVSRYRWVRTRYRSRPGATQTCSYDGSLPSDRNGVCRAAHRATDSVILQ